MSKTELLESYASGQIGRRQFIRGLVGLGASLTVAATFAVALRPTGGVSGQDVYYLYTPTPTNTTEPTSTPTETPEPTSTPTETPEPTSTPTETPEPTTVPVPDADLTVTGDPRFEVPGLANTSGSGLTYTLGTGPANGSVIVAPDGSFIYIADSYLVNGDTFTVIAIDSNGDSAVITVTVVLQVDKSIPTSGSVSPGSGGGGGVPNDARFPNEPLPTSVPDENDDDTEGDDDFDPRT
jgi:hypothetical protein